MILPRNEAYKGLVLGRGSINKNGHFPRGECFLRETQSDFDRLLKLLILTESRSESLRQRLAKRKDFDMNKAFDAIDKDNKGHISRDDIMTFLLTKGFIATLPQVALFFDRVDRFKSEMPKKEDFIRELKPKTDIEFN